MQELSNASSGTSRRLSVLTAGCPLLSRRGEARARGEAAGSRQRVFVEAPSIHDALTLGAVSHRSIWCVTQPNRCFSLGICARAWALSNSADVHQILPATLVHASRRARLPYRPQ